LNKQVVRIVDADVVVYRAAFAAEKNKYCVHVGDEIKIHVSKHAEAVAYASTIEDAYITKEHVVEPVENALQNVNSLMHKLTDGFEYEAYLTGKGNFRHGIATIKKYKGNRDKAPKPVHYDAVRAYLMSRWKAKLINDQEADDEIAIRMYELRAEGKTPVIVSNDKDLDMIEGEHYNFTRETEYVVSKEDAWRAYYMQCLTGDSTDNIPGIEGVGPVGAAKILAGVNGAGAMREAARAAWREHYKDGVTRDDGSVIDADTAFKEVAQLLWIRRQRVLAPPSSPVKGE
jgi:DNA polymerase-1